MAGGNELLSFNMFLHGMAGFVFLIFWKYALENSNMLRKRIEWISGIAILLAFAGAKENIDRELTLPALMDVASYIWFAPIAMWFMKAVRRQTKREGKEKD